MSKSKVLFVCIHNSARSQMAAALLNHLCADQFEAHSAGLEPGNLNPLAVEAMRQIGVSAAKAKSVSEKFQRGEFFSHVVTVCDETSGERCPVFPGAATRLHWSFPDPSAFAGTWEEKVAKTIEVREMIAAKIREWCATVSSPAETCCA
jgi:arsenate reductase